jgi:hypothetical protein
MTNLSGEASVEDITADKMQIAVDNWEGGGSQMTISQKMIDHILTSDGELSQTAES